MDKAVFAAPLVGLGAISSFSKFTHFRSVNKGYVLSVITVREGCITQNYGSLCEGRF